mgnify:CR=1 FL=1
MFTVFDVNQLSAVAAGDIGDDKVFHRLVLRVIVIVGAARKPNANTPVGLAIGAIDMVNHMIGDEDILVVNRDVPFNGITLQVAKFTVGDFYAVELIMETLA